jgi:hypothetical protein
LRNLIGETKMSEVKVKHRGGFTATKPKVDKSAHKEQVPGAAAGGTHMGDMSWGKKK